MPHQDNVQRILVKMDKDPTRGRCPNNINKNSILLLINASICPATWSSSLGSCIQSLQTPSLYVNQIPSKFPDSRKTLPQLTTAGLEMATISSIPPDFLYGQLSTMLVPNGLAVGGLTQQPGWLSYCICVYLSPRGDAREVRNPIHLSFFSQISRAIPFQFSTNCGSETTQIFICLP